MIDPQQTVDFVVCWLTLTVVFFCAALPSALYMVLWDGTVSYVPIVSTAVGAFVSAFFIRSLHEMERP